MYKEKRRSRSEFVPIRGLNYHIRLWPETGQPGLQARSANLPPLVLVHGWMDVAASYQFMVDALSDDFASGRTIIAPDWRGFGETPSALTGQADTYWFADYLADLDFLLDHYAKDQAVDLVGHSMGGNVAMLYAGVRPARIRRLINLEGFGMPAKQAHTAPSHYAKWMNELKTLHRGELTLKAYDTLEGVAQRLMKTNRRLPEDKAHWLASHWSRPNSAGKWEILGESGHKVSGANLYRVEETLAIYQHITAPVLAVEASDDSMSLWWKGQYGLSEYHERLKHVPQARVALIEDAGHMLHHDRPAELARLIEDFLA